MPRGIRSKRLTLSTRPPAVGNSRAKYIMGCVLRCQRDELLTTANEESISANYEGINPAFEKVSEGRIDLVFGAGRKNMNVLAECAPRRQHLFGFLLSGGEGGVYQHRDHCDLGRQLL